MTAERWVDMTLTMAIKDIRKNISRLPEQLSQDPESGAVTVTRRGKPVLAVLSWDLYEAIMETLEVMGDDELMADLKRGIAEVQDGKGVQWEKAREGLDL